MIFYYFHDNFRLHYAIQAYKELLKYVRCMGESQDYTLCRNSTIMKSNILYSQLCRDIIVDIIKSYDEKKSSRAFLRDLVETVHIYIQLIKRFCENKSTVLVKRKRMRKKHGVGGSEKKSMCVC